ncbi:tyrosine-type recombinase/integrase [Chitinilyticum aquatile]|uniref:tyrosine-type recombinase/integrase n=1 Tax=Chitinilyticum aquatile TaxID=362520 RepID=UPI0006869A4E|nr:tyrosine-type recombinase/integrase [Chitinilyticum aquatile]
MTTLTPQPSFSGVPAELQKSFEAAIGYLRAQLAPATLRAYQSDFRIFCDWCERFKLATTPATPETLALFLSDQADSGVAAVTLERRLASIRYVHQMKELPSPTDHPLVRGTLTGIRRIHGTLPRNQKEPILDHQVFRMLQLTPDTLLGLRDRAIIALGFAGAFRRSELAALDVSDLKFDQAGNLVCLIRRGKTDQGGSGFEKPILNGRRLQPVTHLKAWLSTAGIDEGAVFRRVDWAGAATEQRLSAQWMARVVKNYANQIGLGFTEFGAHSLRSGFITSAGERDVQLYKIMEVTGQKDPRTVLRYLRRANLFKDHAGEDFL